MIRSLLLTTALATLPTLASAADLMVKAPPRAVEMPFSWAGAYVGLHAGIAGFKQFADSSGDKHGTGGVVGVHGGYNWQSGNIVYGIEGDIGYSTAAANYDHSTQLDTIASIRGRLGLAFGRVLVYGTGGVAWTHWSFASSATDTRGTKWRTQAVVGGVLEFALVNNITMRAEGLAYLGKVTNPFLDEDSHVKNTFVGRVGMSYKW